MKDDFMRVTVSIVTIVVLGLTNLQVSGQDQDSTAFKKVEEETSSNPVLRRFKVEELKEFRRHYQEEIEQLVAKKDSLRKKAIQDLENLLANHPETPSLDKILLRLAELHYEQAVQNYAQALDDESSCCGGDSLEAAGLTAESFPEPEKDFTRPLQLFERLIQEVPNSPLIADALYNKGFVLEELGRTEEAFETYLQLADNYPESEYVADALMRMAEYHFNPPNRDMEKSIALYQRVLNYKGSPLYDAALYRLGWANYTSSNYPEAIAYFTLLADDIDRIKPLDPERKYHFPAVQDEAIEYIGISFLDFGGADYASKYFEEIGGRYYGLNVLKKIGDSQLEVLEEHDKAISAYEHLLEAYPEYAQAPDIQAKIADAY
ncbi:MAG: tol-pal system YbgF family protein, partial [bacterium]